MSHVRTLGCEVLSARLVMRDIVALAFSFGVPLGAAAALAWYVRFQLRGPLARMRPGVPSLARLRCDLRTAREVRDALTIALRSSTIATQHGGGPGRARLLISHRVGDGARTALTLEVGRPAKRKHGFELDLRAGRPALVAKPAREPSLAVGAAIDAAVRKLPGATDVSWSTDGEHWYDTFDEVRDARA